MIKFKKGTTKDNQKEYVFLLRDLVYCKNCGRKMVYKNSNPIRIDKNGKITGIKNELGYFICAEHYRHKDVCNEWIKIKENTFNDIFSKGSLMNTSRNIISGVNSLSELPTELLSFVKDVNRGETKIDIEMANSDKQVDKLEKMLHQLVIGLLDAAVLLGACMVDNKILRAIYIILGTIFTVWLFIQMAKDHFHSGY